MFDQTPLIIGHRGAAGLTPENTLPSFVQAVALGVDAVELDVHRCEDALVVIHDDTLERTTNGHGAVDRTPLTALRALDAGNGAQIPLLEEVLEALPAEIGINIELKGKNTAELLARASPIDGNRVLVSSFNHQLLRSFGAARGDCPLAPLFGRWQRDPITTAVGFGGGFINLGRKIASPERVRLAAEAKLKVLVYTVNDLEEARRLFEIGVWGVFTDFPDRISRAAL